MWPLLKEKLVEVLKAVLPLIGFTGVLQIAIVGAPADVVVQFLVGSLLVIVGMLLLFIGIDFGILPMGRFVGAELPKTGSIVFIAAMAFAFGFATTMAEPDVLVLAGQVDAASGGAIARRHVLLAIALGVGVFTAMAIARIILGWSIRVLLTIAYGVVIVLSLFAPAEITPLSYDAGSVTTGLLSAPVIIAIALGMSAVLAGRSTVSDGFGVLGLASIGPIIVVLLAGIFWS